MARVMRDATVETTASKLFKACDASWTVTGDESWRHWNAVVRAWAVGATRPLHDEDRHALVARLQELDSDWISYERRVDYDWHGQEKT
ncbi:hypothetical protein [Agrobacterium fabrum]|uniref:hypothetical protein n=1 Tax=Agrobacterium fabrum TaxID=1176649 RepID=UPI003B9E6459